MASPIGYRTFQDASLNPATFTLPSAASASTQSAIVDLGADTAKLESYHIELSIPSLTSTIAPSTSTVGVTYIVESSSSSTFGTTARTLCSKAIVGSTVGVVATVLRTRVPPDCERYVRGKVTFGATTTDASAVAGTLSLRF